MDNNVFLIVLFASAMHAIWNGMVKNHSDKAIAISGIVFGRLPLSLIAIIMIPLASYTAKRLGKRMSKVATEAQEKSGDLNKHLIEIFNNHKLIKIFQRESFENERSEKFINDLKEKTK